MKTLRKLVEGWRSEAEPELGAERDEWDVGSANALEHCADALSSTLPAWERLEKAAENSLRARGGGQKDCGHDFECVCPDEELRAALKEIQS